MTAKTNPNPQNLTAVVRVRMEVEVTVGTWGAENNFVSLRDQAIRESVQQLDNVLRKHPSSIRIVGAPKSMSVTLNGDFKE